jgi:hypothetical protein
MMASQRKNQGRLKVNRRLHVLGMMVTPRAGGTIGD